MGASNKVSNPYSTSWDNQVQSTFGDSSLSSSGIHTTPTGLFNNWSKEDQANFEVDMANAQWLAQLSLIDYQNQYNSPENQVRLMRQAGLNPDLLGTSGVQASAGGTPPSMTSPQGVNNTEVVSKAASIFASVMSLTGAMAEGVVNISGKMLDNDIKNLDKVQKSITLGSEVAAQLRPKSVDSYAITLDDGSTVLDPSLISADLPFPSFGLSRRNQRNLNRIFQRYRETPSTLSKYYGYEKDLAEKRMKLGEVTSDPRYGATDAEITEAWRPYTKAMADMTKEMLSSQTLNYKLSGQNAQNRMDFKLPYLSASAEASSLNLQKDNTDLLNKLKSPLYKVASNLEKKAQEGKQWANYMLIALYTALSASFGVSSGPKGTTSSFSFGY